MGVSSIYGRERGPREQRRDVSVIDLLAVIAGSCRVEILCHLHRQGPMGVTSLAQAIELEVATVSHQLRILYEYGIVDRQVSGTYRYYRLDPSIQVCRQADGMIRLEVRRSTGEYASVLCRAERETSKRFVEPKSTMNGSEASAPNRQAASNQ